MSNEIAQTILAQLGGSRLLAMTGAKNLLSTAKGCSSTCRAATPGTRQQKALSP
ncbi:hypothetical protein ACVI3U_002838 [Sinorhizobium medicae]